MGHAPRAHLAYGYSLGSNEHLDFRERNGDYGSDLNVDWWISYDPAGDDDQDVLDAGRQIYRRLFEQIPDAPTVEYDWEMDDHVKRHYGVELVYPGGEESTGYALIAVGSERSVEWDETMALDLAAMASLPFSDNWNMRLDYAVGALGITPTQDGPKWLVYPSYG